MKGFVPTPPETVDLMIDLLFLYRHPRPGDRILDPGCGEGEFIEGIIRWCSKYGTPVPEVVGVDSDARHIATSITRFSGYPTIKIREEDFLLNDPGKFEFVIGNPPYVPITQLSEEEKAIYRARFRTARGRFDLYHLFFEQALRALKSEGRLVFITPEKFLYVETTSVLRRLLYDTGIEEIRLVPEDTFGSLVTYPTITTIQHHTSNAEPRIVLRDGSVKTTSLPQDGSSWLGVINQERSTEMGPTLQDIAIRISAGVATGSDTVFVHPRGDVTEDLLPFAYPTVSGRQLTNYTEGEPLSDVMLTPYGRDGTLIPFENLGALGDLINRNEPQLRARTCVRRKPWYSFHENPPLPDILRPKLLCKDIAKEPHFVVDATGEIVPRHSVYYIVPHDPTILEPLRDYLNSDLVREWLEAHCQRAANNFLRVQSHILKNVPIGPLISHGSASEMEIERGTAAAREV